MSTPSEFVPMILPTVLIPLTMVSVGISVLATFIAALFGIQLKLEGPKKLLEVLLKPKVLASAFVLNALIFGGMYGWKWWKNYPRLIRTIEGQAIKYSSKSDVNYVDVPTVSTQFAMLKEATAFPNELEQSWRYQADKGAFRAPLVSHDRVFYGNLAGYIKELDLMTGKEIRSFYIGTPVTSELSLWQNSLYNGEGVHDTHHARIYRFDLKTGLLVGTYQTLGHTEAQGVIGSFEGENTLFAVGGVDGLHAIDPVTMQGKWKVNLGHMDAGILVDQGSVYMGTGRERDDDKKNKCYAAALDFKTGKILWQRELAASSWMRPVLLGENVCYVAGEIYFPTQRGHITCFDRQTGNHTIAMNTTDPLAGTPKVLDDTILYTSIHGLVCRFDMKTKTNQWCFDADEKDTKSLAGASYDPRTNAVIYPSMTKGLFVLNPHDGKVLMNWKPTKEQGEWKKTFADVTVAGEFWIVADFDGSVRGLRPKFDPKTAKK